MSWRWGGWEDVYSHAVISLDTHAHVSNCRRVLNLVLLILGRNPPWRRQKPLEEILKSAYIPVDAEKCRGFGFRGAKDGASGGDGLSPQLLCQGGWDGSGGRAQ